MISIPGTVQSEISLQPPEFTPVKWLEGAIIDNSAPEYLIPSQRRRGQLDGVDHSKLFVKIGDLGGGMMHLLLPSKPSRRTYIILATSSRQCEQLPGTPTALRAPELIHRNPWNAGIDIWALGCLV